jgi:hypothetical protein
MLLDFGKPNLHKENNWKQVRFCLFDLKPRYDFETPMSGTQAPGHQRGGSFQNSFDDLLPSHRFIDGS